MSIETKHHSPVVYKVYDELKNHVGKKNSIPAKDLADKVCLSERALRDVIREIRKSTDLEKAIGCCNLGYHVCTQEDCENAIKRFYRQAFGSLEVARALEKKVGLNGQGKIKTGDYVKAFYQSLGEIE